MRPALAAMLGSRVATIGMAPFRAGPSAVCRRGERLWASARADSHERNKPTLLCVRGGQGQAVSNLGAAGFDGTGR